MLARRDEMSFDSNLITTFDAFREIVAFSPVFGSVERSGASASRIEAAVRFDLAEMTISAAQFVEVNIVCA